ncbi:MULTISPECIES: hypothetical protein [unclassified Rathayibacter]|uniref:hypothetical protein n=1 Tax=unclassified Rathayibacter TaxID=2609250 RepID=UPI00188A1849|nr:MULTISPECIES: hypothetical protein [unclassified Rathayibacter]MBF4461698.1 hypothetical protein [Rathayibacter sp. VKM Ac-2879]MBF4503109.1 hypothetical protein [Rathayibacter sp. VKM Ac-2878]
MKKLRAIRVGSRWWAGAGLLVVAVLSFLAAPGVDAVPGAMFGAGAEISQGALLRVLAVLDVIAGVWVLVQPRSYPGLTAAAVAVIALWLAPRMSAPALLDVGGFALDVRFVILPLQVTVLLAGLAVTVFWMTRNLRARTETGAER